MLRSLLLLCCVCAVTTIASASPARPAITAPDVLDRIAAATSHARVVFLGEPDHGDGGSMRARAELIERLHRDHGVRWVVFESSMFDARRVDAAIRRGDDPIDAARDGILDIWASATELDPLFRLAARSARTDAPLRIAGMDSTPVGPVDRCLHCEDLRTRLATVEPDDLRRDTIAMLDELERWWIELDRSTRRVRPDDLVASLDRVAAALARAGHDGLAREIRGWAVWMRSTTPRPPLTQDQIDERDALMAANLLALLRSIPDEERVVVILHDVHAMRRLRDVSRADGTTLAGMTVPVAEFVCRELDDDAYCLALAAASGHVQASWNPAPRVIDLPADAFERRALAGSDAESVFVTCGPDGTAPRGVMPGGMISFGPFRADWNAMFDGVWILRETHGVTRRDRDRASDE